MLGLLEASGEQNGRDYTTSLITSQVVPSYDDTTLPAVRQYREAMDRVNPPPPSGLVDQDYEPLRYSFVSFEGFLNAEMLVEIVRRMGDRPERGRIPEVAEGITGFDLGIGAPVTFGAGRHQGLDTVYFTTVKEGRFVPVVNWEEWAR
jgi:hypothetical protein